jgi:hypothetical protein
MKVLLAVIVIVAAAWSAYWYVAQRSARAGFERWFAERRADGWQAEYASLTMAGYPNRVDATFEKPVLVDPDTGLGWEGTNFHIYALSYRPNQLIVSWPEQQKFFTPEASYLISSRDMGASIVMAPKPSLPLQRAHLVAKAMAVEAPDGTTTLDGLQMAVDLLPGATQDYRIGFNADGYAPPLPAGVTLQTGGQLPQQLDALRADLSISFTRPWDITALQDSRPQPTRIKVSLAEAKWGALELALAGDLQIDEAGLPTGALTLKARNWRDIVGLARQLGWLPAAWLDSAEKALGLAAQLSGNQRTLDLPLTFRPSGVSLGPVPLGPAPVLRLR